MPRSPHLATWTGHEIYEECRVAYAAYARAKTESYVAYFAAHPELRDPQHPYKARDLAAALPEEWGGSPFTCQLAAGISITCRATPVRLSRSDCSASARSATRRSVGCGRAGARRRRRSQGRPRHSVPEWQFKLTLAPEVLGERPRQTSIDFTASDPAALLCIECKWVEAGLGACSCPAPAPLTGTCSDRVLEREAYWKAAYEVFHLPEREVGKPCPLSPNYQAVRQVAAALALAKDGQLPVFGLIYDAENPYFAGSGAWPGWPAALHATLPADTSPFRFVSASWQELVPLLQLDPAAAFWGSEKHGLDKGVRTEF